MINRILHSWSYIVEFNIDRTKSCPLRTGRPPWLLIFSALNRLSSRRCGFESRSCHMWDKPSSPCGWQVVILGDLPFSPHLTIDSAQNEIILTGRKTQIIIPLTTRNSIYASWQRQKHTCLHKLGGVKGLCSFYLLTMDERLNLVTDVWGMGFGKS